MTSSTRQSGGPKHFNWTLVAVFAIVALVGGVVGGFVGYALHPSSASAAGSTASANSCSIPKVADAGPAICGHH